MVLQGEGGIALLFLLSLEVPEVVSVASALTTRLLAPQVVLALVVLPYITQSAATVQAFAEAQQGQTSGVGMTAGQVGGVVTGVAVLALLVTLTVLVTIGAAQVVVLDLVVVACRVPGRLLRLQQVPPLPIQEIQHFPCSQVLEAAPIRALGRIVIQSPDQEAMDLRYFSLLRPLFAPRDIIFKEHLVNLALKGLTQAL